MEVHIDAPAAEPRLCERCKKPIPAERLKRKRTRFCRPTCQQNFWIKKTTKGKASRKRRNTNPTARKRFKRALAKHQLFLDELKSKPCIDCGGTFPPECMDFDHRDPSEKCYNIGQKRGSRVSQVNLMLEVNKCDLVCANCHRVRTRKQALARWHPVVVDGVLMEEEVLQAA